MKKGLILLFSVLILTSCGSAEVVNEARKTLDGNWNLSSITFPGNAEDLNVELLGDANAQCLEGSDWHFVSNNNTGYYAVSDMDCNTETAYFRWSVDAVDPATGNFDFILKPTNSDYESTMGDAGFRINLVTLTQTDMVWEQTVSFEGEPFTIRMNFNKI